MRLKAWIWLAAGRLTTQRLADILKVHARSQALHDFIDTLEDGSLKPFFLHIIQEGWKWQD
jgi:hypothetical protein